MFVYLYGPVLRLCICLLINVCFFLSCLPTFYSYYLMLLWFNYWNLDYFLFDLWLSLKQQLNYYNKEFNYCFFNKLLEEALKIFVPIQFRVCFLKWLRVWRLFFLHLFFNNNDAINSFMQNDKFSVIILR